jgi:hypothetical protein
VSKVSTLQKLGAVVRLAGAQAERSRTASALARGVKTALRSFLHSAHQLWLEVTGTLFLSIAVFGAGALVREYMKYHAGQAASSRVAIVFCFTLAFGWFGVSSFLRARKKRRVS